MKRVRGVRRDRTAAAEGDAADEQMRRSTHGASVGQTWGRLLFCRRAGGEGAAPAAPGPHRRECSNSKWERGVRNRPAVCRDTLRHADQRLVLLAKLGVPNKQDTGFRTCYALQRVPVGPGSGVRIGLGRLIQLKRFLECSGELYLTAKTEKLRAEKKCFERAVTVMQVKAGEMREW